MRDQLEKEISEACVEWLNKHHQSKLNDAELRRWKQQLQQFLTVHWQVWPWETDVLKAIQQFKALPLGKKPADDQTVAPAEALERAYLAAREGIPTKHLDPRNYKHRSWREGDVWKSEIIPGPEGLPQLENPGFTWATHYAQAEFHLAARRNTRDFTLWLIPEKIQVQESLSALIC